MAEHEAGMAGPDPAGREDPREGPRQLRAALADYIRALHRGWLERVQDAGAEVGDLPLGADPFTVAVVAARGLHLLATRDELPPVADHEQVVTDELDGLSWEVRFLDPTVVPELADLDDDADVAMLLGVSTTLYRLDVALDGALSPHQATHAGHGLASSHLRGGRG